MKLNRISIIFCLLGLTMPTFGSNIAGNTEFLKRNYEGAIEQYKETLSNTDSTKSKSETFALYRIGECYSYLNNPEEAVNYLNNAITSGYQEA
jgi:tetratricopeptide (TPR) repeat protein